MKSILLTQNKIALIDDEDFNYLNQFKWQAMKFANGFYAGRKQRIDGKRKTVYMHCDIMNTIGIDHIDGNGLNNQRHNLRQASQSQNVCNAKKRKNGSSQFKGVHWDKRVGKWRARITFNHKKVDLGCHSKEIDAAIAYDAAAQALFGKFAKLNFDAL